MNNRLSNLRLVQSQRGLTIIEIIVVLVILTVIMTFLAGRLFGAGERAKVTLSELKMKDLKSKIEIFQLQYGSVPSSLDDLVHCPEKAGQGCVPLVSEDGIKDSWGTKFSYQSQDNRTYTLKSLGADGKDGGQGADFDITIQGP